jgi:hypothetical protein
MRMLARYFMHIADLSRTGRTVAVDHGFLVGFGFFIFGLLALATGWTLSALVTKRLRHHYPRFGAWGFDAQANKGTPSLQDVGVLAGTVVTTISVLLVQCPSLGRFSLEWLGIALALWHLYGIVVYHVNVLLFDEFYPGQDSRVWSHRRVFIQAVLNLIETVFIFAALYENSAGISFARSVFWSVQGLTLNTPYDWKDPQRSVAMLWLAQIAMSLFFLVIVLALIGSVMFKREEISEARRHAR